MRTFTHFRPSTASPKSARRRHAYTGQSISPARSMANQVVQVRLKAEDAASFVQRSDGEGEWVRDEGGNLYYKTQPEAETRLAALKKKGEWNEYRITSFERKGTTYWRVEMRGPKTAAPPEEESPPAPKEETPPAPAEEAPAATPETSKSVCLTFDDGPQDGTQEVLDVLNAHNAPATFFLTGINMASDPDRQRKLVAAMLADPKFQIANHTYTHNPAAKADYLSKYGDLSDPEKEKKFKENYTKNQEHFKNLFSASKTPFPGFNLARLPGDGRFIKHGSTRTFVEATEKMGMKHVTWHFEFGPNKFLGGRKGAEKDWKGVTGFAAEPAGWPRDKAIVLFHDRHWQGGSKDSLTKILTKLVSNGYAFGRISSEGTCT